MWNIIQRYIGNIIPEQLHHDQEKFRKARLITGFTVMVMVIFPVYVVTHYIVGDTQGALVILITIMVYPLVILVLRRTGSLPLVGNFGIFLFYCISTYFSYTQGGLASPSMIAKMASPAAALVFSGRRSMIVWILIESSTIIIFYLLAIAGYSFPHHIPPEWLLFDRVTQLLGVIIAVSVLFLLSETERAKTQQSLILERRKSDALLINVLPVTIAERLKTDTSIIADVYHDVTVLFADIVGFTQLSSKIQPEILVDILNRIFTEFDQLVERYKLEKIKTIGDAYMVVGGVPVADRHHARHIGFLALDMIQSLDRLLLPIEDVRLQLRIGIHCGEVVAGVIGKRKFSYDLWGDTVNIASRMESHGKSHCIHCSEVVYHRLNDIFVFQERGEIEIKGKGSMKTYFLLSRKPHTG